ncbi:MAG: BTAD domain-containing putative transcriptional regulator [Vulcanimicrobiota bacterium]
MEEKTTEQVLFPEGEEYVSTSLELVVSLPDGATRRLPLTRRLTRIAAPGQNAHLELPGAATIKISWIEQQLIFWSDPRGPATLHNQKPSRGGVLNLQDRLSWSGCEMQLVDRAHQLRATLECTSSPFFARIWPIDEEQTLLGRRGQRQNHLELDHPTISRSHATILWDQSGARIRCDTKNSLVVVAGQQVAYGDCANLLDGASLQLGELNFRFRFLREVEPRLRGPRLNVTSLGAFVAERGGEPVSEKSWRTVHVRWLLARLALDWGRPVASELLLELFWPGMQEASAKNNLNFSLSTLRSVLRSDGFPQVDYFLRTRTTIQLEPELLGRHDAHELQEVLANGRQLSGGERASAYWKRALDLYQAPYLEGCFMEWALQTRTRLQNEVLEVGRLLLRYAFDRKDWNTVADYAPQVLRIDPCCQSSAAFLMRAQVERGNPHEAFRIYEACLLNLDRELGVSAGLELKAAYELALNRFPD